MDSIDFNSYLLKETNGVQSTHLHKKIYRGMVRRADEIVNTILKTPNNNLIQKLFEAKKDRFEARKQTKRDEEKNRYIDATHKLHKAFDRIPKEAFYATQKKQGTRLHDNFNWVKVLFYNEMAICYSGLAESSMSLGYAERAKELLEGLYPALRKVYENKENYRERLKKEIEKKEGKNNITEKADRVVALYTFALYNKGEAERLLHNYDSSERTFSDIVEIYMDKDKEKKPSDYYSALLHMASILIDQGRGKEALSYLDEAKFPDPFDYRIQECDLEKARALIDRKEYIGKNGAYVVLKPYIKKRYWKYTFTQRKAKVYELRLLIEFKRNRPEDFNKTEEHDEIETLKHKYGKFQENAKHLLEECVGRYDGGNFRKTCKALADYFHEEGKWERELCSYYLYLCYKPIFEKRDKLREKSKDANKIIDDWISQAPDLASLITEYDNENLVEFSQVLSGVDDEPCLRGFFNAYYEICTKNKHRPNKQEKTIIGKLKERLIAVYHEKDNLIELGEVEEKFSLLQDKIEPKEDKENDQERENVVKFVRERFFKVKQTKGDEHMIYLRPDSITTKMEQNTNDFVYKIVGRTKLLPRDEKFRGRLIVLRRWNSFTPALASSVNPSKGGGYFLYFWYKNEPLGIVLDPGYDFLDNLFSQGFRIGDINTVIVSHAHPDHTDNLPAILSLFHERNRRLGEYHHKKKSNINKFNRKHLELIVSQGVFDQYYKLIKPSEASLKDIFVVETGKDKQSNSPIYKHEFRDNYSLEIEPRTTSHKDLSQWESLGFIFKIINNGEIITQIGYTSDAHWTRDFSKKFKGCNVICAHLGSIVDILEKRGFCDLCKKNGSGNCKNYDKCREENFKNGEPTQEKLLKQAREQSHLYLSGLAMFFDEFLSNGDEKNNEMKLAVISEFGEELKGGMRMDLYHKFDDWFKERSKGNARCLPGDIGLEIDLLNYNICCCCCQEYKSKDRISPIAYGKEEAIFFVCDECKSVLSTYQIEEELRDYYENGRKLELADESK